MQGDDSSNDDSLISPADTTTIPTRLETHSDDVFMAELRDLELRLEQLELEQQSLRIQLQRARLRSVERTTAPSSVPPTTHSRPQQPSGRLSPTPGRSPSHTGRNKFTSRHNPIAARYHCALTRPVHLTPAPTIRAQVLEQCTPQAGDHLDATDQVLRIGDEVSFLATNHTMGGTTTV